MSTIPPAYMYYTAAHDLKRKRVKKLRVSAEGWPYFGQRKPIEELSEAPAPARKRKQVRA